MKKILATLFSYLLLTSFANGTHEEGHSIGRSFQCHWAKKIGEMLKFENGSIFCEEKKGMRKVFDSKLTHKNFLELEVTGSWHYPNGDRFVGKFKNGKKLGGYFYKEGSKKSTYQKWWKNASDYLAYEVDSQVQDHAKCKVVDWKSTRGAYIKYWDWEDYQVITDENEIKWCTYQYRILNIFGLYKIYYKEIYKWPVIIFAAILLIIFIIYVRKKGYVFKRSKTKLSKAKKRKLESEPSGIGLTSKIARLEKLYRKGTLTKAEFEKAKNKLLK